MAKSMLLALAAALCAQSVVASPKPTGYGVKQPIKATTTTTSKVVQPTCKAQAQRDANFDDLTGIPGSVLNPIPIPYMGLYYQGLDFTTIVETNLAPGVIPHSGTNYAIADAASELNGTPMLTINFPGSTTNSFNLQSFYFGCSVSLANGATAVPNQCNIEVTGYRGSDNSINNAKQVCSKQFQYNPTTQLGAQQQAFSGTIAGCNDLSFAIVTFTPPGGQAALASTLALVLDDVRYTTCQN